MPENNSGTQAIARVAAVRGRNDVLQAWKDGAVARGVELDSRRVGLGEAWRTTPRQRSPLRRRAPSNCHSARGGRDTRKWTAATTKRLGGAEVRGEELELHPKGQVGGAKAPQDQGEADQQFVDPGQLAECRLVRVVGHALVLAKVGGGKEDPASYVVEDRQPERVEGAEA